MPTNNGDIKGYMSFQCLMLWGARIEQEGGYCQLLTLYTRKEKMQSTGKFKTNVHCVPTIYTFSKFLLNTMFSGLNFSSVQRVFE